MSEPIQIAVTGAAGRVSYALLFRIAAGAMFGIDRPIALSLLEVPEAMPLLDATMMELDDCDFPLLRSVRRFDRCGRDVRRRRLGHPGRQRSPSRGDDPGRKPCWPKGPMIQVAWAGDQRVGHRPHGFSS